MKSKLTILLALLLLIVGCVSFTACGSDGESNGDGMSIAGKVSDDEWKELLSLNFEAAKSFTVKSTYKSTHSESQAQEYGEYYDNVSTTYVDSVNEIIYTYDEDYMYDETDEKCYHSYHKNYTLKHNGKYYSVSYYDNTEEEPESTPKWTCNEITKADLTREIEYISNEFAIFNAYSDPMMKEYVFQYNSETKTYEMNASFGSFGYGLQFLDNGGITLLMQLDSLTKTAQTFYDVEKTTVSAPNADALKAIDDYVASQAE